MNLFEYTQNSLKEYLSDCVSLHERCTNLKSTLKGKKISFYPCGKFTHQIIDVFLKKEIIKLDDIKAIYDLNKNAFSKYPVKTLCLPDQFQSNEDDLLILSSNNFYRKNIEEFRVRGFCGQIVPLSYFDFSFGLEEKETVFSNFNKAYNSLNDDQSKVTYLLNWLARAKNDPSYLSVFASEKGYSGDGKITHWKGYELRNLGVEVSDELFADVYGFKKTLPKEGDTVFDIGAFKGDTAVYFSDLVGDLGHVCCFEPDASNLKDLLENIQLNNFGSVVDAFNVAVSKEAGKEFFISNKSGVPWAHLTEDESNSKVEVISIDSFVESNQDFIPNLIKMDVEGKEMDVLKGAKDTISKYRPNLIIPLYHETRDFIDIPNYIDSFGIYDLFIRCYTDSPWGITMFCSSRGE